MLLVSRPVRTQEENVRAGILWMLATALLFVSLDATAKYMVGRLPILEVVWARFVFHLLFALILLGPKLPTLIKTRALGLQMVRSAFLMVTTALFFIGVSLLPLAEASAIMFTSPIMLTLLALIFLGEQVGPRRWAAIGIGFLGALIVVRPGLGVMGPGLIGTGALVLLGCAFCNACYQIFTRKLRATDDPRTTLLYTAVAGTIGTSLALPTVWVAPAPVDWPFLVLLGAFGCFGHFTLIKAFQSAPAVVVAPFSYTNLIWSIGLGYLIFGDLPDLWTLVGAAIIAGGGLYILHREQVRKKEAAAAAREEPAPT